MQGITRRRSNAPAGRKFSAALVATLGVVVMSCATPSVKVEVDENEDFSNYRTWDWMPQIRPRVEGRYAVTPVLDLRVQRMIEASLEERGFRRTEPPADFYITFRLTIQPKAKLTQNAVAPYVLNSLHSTPSYYIERTEVSEHRFDDFYLAMGITEGGGRMTWQATFEKHIEPNDSLPIEAAVEELFEHFPASRPLSDSPEQP